MLERLPRVPVDTFLLALLAVVTLAALFPATGTFADALRPTCRWHWCSSAPGRWA